jgi:hypothetical protein
MLPRIRLSRIATPFKTSGFWFALFVLILIPATQTPYLVHRLIAGPPAAYNYTQGVIMDYNMYLSAITLGKSGSWLFRNPYTSEPSPHIPLFLFYTVLGRLAAPFDLWPPYAYHGAKILLMAAYAASLLYLCRSILPKRAAVWAAVTGLLLQVGPQPLWEPFAANAWSGVLFQMTESSYRFDEMPHHLFSQTMMVLSLAFLFRSLTGRHRFYLIASGLTAALSAYVLPSMTIPLFAILPLAMAVLAITNLLNRKPPVDLRVAWRIAVPVTGALGAAVLLSWQIRSTQLLKLATDFEIAVWNRSGDVDRAFLVCLALALAVTLPAVIRGLTSGKFVPVFVSLWALTPLILLPFTPWFTFGKARLMQNAPFVPFGIAAAWMYLPTGKTGHRVTTVLRIAVFVAVLAYSAGMTGLSIRQRIDAEKRLRYANIELPSGFMAMTEYIRANVLPDAVILTDQVTGSGLPAYAPVVSFIGPFTSTARFDEKLTVSYGVLNNMFTPGEVRKTIAFYGIDYILTGGPPVAGMESRLLKRIDNFSLYGVRP